MALQIIHEAWRMHLGLFSEVHPYLGVQSAPYGDLYLVNNMDLWRAQDVRSTYVRTYVCTYVVLVYTQCMYCCMPSVCVA